MRRRPCTCVQIMSTVDIPTEAFPSAQPQAHCNDLWDAHGCLNAVSRCVADVPAAVARALYAVADHLRMLSQINANGGWATPDMLREWIVSLLNLQGGPEVVLEGSCVIELPRGATHVFVAPLGAVIIPLVRRFPGIECLVLHLEAHVDADEADDAANAWETVAGCRINGLGRFQDGPGRRNLSAAAETRVRFARLTIAKPPFY